MQCTSHILMVRPAAFGYDPETAASNAFQQESELGAEALARQARTEFDGMVELLRGEGVQVHVLEDSADPVKPDAVFPNNWFSTHAAGQLVLYPMLSSLRRAERRPGLSDELEALGFEVGEELDLSSYEEQGRFLEGTGSMVLDRVHRRVYACRSPRTDAGLLDAFCQELDYEPVVFGARDASGVEFYHTNVMMALGSEFAVVCLEALDAEDQKALLRSLNQTWHEIVEISLDQVRAFAGNMLEVWNGSERLLVLSQAAFDVLNPRQKKQLEEHVRLLPVAVPTIELVGGGSVRCMMAEIFLPLKNS